MLLINAKQAIAFILDDEFNTFKNSYVTKNFKWGEFFIHRTNEEITSCAKDQSYVFDHIKLMADFLQKFRAFIGNKSINISSGWRGVKFNTSLPNASSTSYHIDGLATDFNVSGLTPRQVQRGYVGFAKHHGCEWGLNTAFTHISYPQEEANELKTITKRSKALSGNYFEQFTY